MSLTRHAAQAQGRYPRVPPRRQVTRERLLEQLHLDGAKVDRAARVLQQFGRLPPKALLWRIVREDGMRVGS